VKWGLENEPFRVWVVRLCHDSAEWGREPIAFIDARIGASAEGEESFRLRSIEKAGSRAGYCEVQLLGAGAFEKPSEEASAKPGWS
jgi:hypothetical protein